MVRENRNHPNFSHSNGKLNPGTMDIRHRPKGGSEEPRTLEPLAGKHRWVGSKGSKWRP